MSTSLMRGNLRFTTIIIVAVIMLLLIPGIALSQDNNQEEPSTEVEIQITDESSSGFFEGISTFVWVLGVVLLVIIILLVFLVGRSGNRGRE